MDKKKIIKKAMKGKGGLVDVAKAGIKGFKGAYSANMKKYKAQSGIDKNMFPDGIRSASKGLIWGAGKAGQEAVKGIKNKISKKGK